MSQHAPGSPQSHWSTPRGAQYLGPRTDPTPLGVTLVLRRRRGAALQPALWPRRPQWQRDQFEQHCGGDPADLASLRVFAARHGLRETGADLTRRVLHLSGTPPALERAFGVTLGRYQLADGRGPFVSVGQAPAVPPEAIAVLGLDRRPVARAQSRRPRSTPTVTYTPLQLGQLYEFPADSDGSGQSVAIIELGGGFTSSDLAQFLVSIESSLRAGTDCAL